MALFKSCIFFLADGARPDLFEENLKSGDFPNISQYIVDRGSYRRGTTVFPSTTGPAYLPFLTGCYPGQCNVPGIRWFDRREFGRKIFSMKGMRSYVGFGSYMMNKDMNPDIPTLFEIFDNSVNVFSSINRGIGVRGNRSKLSRILYFYYGHLTDRWNFVDHAAIQNLLNALDNKPDYAFVVLPAIDEYAHLSTPFSDHTRKAYRDLDGFIGQVGQRLEKLGRLDETLMVISSDHGLSTTENHFGVDRFLEDNGMRTLFYPLIYKRNFSAATMVSGNGMCNVYIRGNKSWQDPITFEDMTEMAFNIPQALVEREEVDFVAGRGKKGEIVVLSQKGRAHIQRSNGHYQYQPIEGDPLGMAKIANRPLEEEESLELTFDSDYPDALVQLEQIFQSPRCGDLIVSAKPGFDLRDRFESPIHRGSHGSLHREHMHVPVAISAPVLSGPIRTVDLFPTILNYMGREIPKAIDGKNRREVA